MNIVLSQHILRKIPLSKKKVTWALIGQFILNKPIKSLRCLCHNPPHVSTVSRSDWPRWENSSSCGSLLWCVYVCASLVLCRQRDFSSQIAAGNFHCLQKWTGRYSRLVSGPITVLTTQKHNNPPFRPCRKKWCLWSQTLIYTLGPLLRATARLAAINLSILVASPICMYVIIGTKIFHIVKKYK